MESVNVSVATVRTGGELDRRLWDAGENGYWNDSCFEPSLFYSSVIVSWNRTLMHELMVNRRCNCDAIVTVNQLTNLMCVYFPTFRHSWWVQCIYIFMFGLIIAMSVGGNCIVVWIVLAHKRMRTVTNYFLLNLAVADTSISLFNVCFSFTYNLYYDWWFGELYCSFNNMMGVVPTCASVFTLMTMSIDRYFAIVYPLQGKLSKHKVLGIITTIWVAAALCGLPMLMHSHTITFFYDDGSTRTLCLSDKYSDGDAKSSEQFKIYNYFLLFVTYLLPLAVLSGTFLRMGHTLRGSSRIGEHRQEKQLRAKRRIIKMLTVVVALFMILWLPYHIYFTFLMAVFADMEVIVALHIYLNMYWLAMSSTVVNPIIYCWMHSRFRTGFKFVFRWLPCVHMSLNEYLVSDLHANVSRETTLRASGSMVIVRDSKKTGAAAASIKRCSYKEARETMKALAPGPRAACLHHR